MVLEPKVLEKFNSLLNMSLLKKQMYAEIVVEKQLDQQSVVSCSFGKDSIVVLYLCLQKQPATKVVYCDTGVEYPEVKAYALKMQKLWGFDLDIVKPTKNFWECVEEFGYPVIRSYAENGKRKKATVPRCCYHLKEKPMKLWLREHTKYSKIFLGLTAMESRQRKLLFLRNKASSCYFDNCTLKSRPLLKVNPIWMWSPENVFEFCRQNDIPLCPTYEKWKIPRLGCWACSAHLDWKRQLREFAPNIYVKAMKALHNQTTLDQVENNA